MKDDQELKQRVTDALHRIARWRDVGGRVMIDLPLRYPSGSMVVVEVEQNRENVWVSDIGHGKVEAEMRGAEDQYGIIAAKIARDLGVDYDGDAIFALWVPVGRIEAAIICVANASQSAANEAIRLASEAKSRKQDDMLFDRIVGVFGRKQVERTGEVSGLRASWQAHNIVMLPHGKRAIFEYMSKYPVAVSSKFIMLSDIRSAQSDIALNVVVPDLQLDAKAQMIGDVANIIPVDAEAETFKQYAMAS